MGLQPEYLAFIEAALARAAVTTGRMVELGNQELRGHAKQPGCRTGKEYFGDRFEHVSLDRNGKDGARVVDLGAPLPRDLVGSFDVLTNSGTSEHIADQYQVWANMHALLRIEGLALHLCPLRGFWGRHPHTYTSGWIERVLIASRDRVLTMHEIVIGAQRRLVAVAAVKTTWAFPTRSAFETIPE